LQCSGTFGFKDGAASVAQFRDPYGLVVAASGDIYITDSNNNRIRKITPAGVVSTFAGKGTIGSINGAGNIAQFNYPHGLALDGAGNMYVADAGNNKIRKITPDGVVSTLAGDGVAGFVNGTGANAEFDFPDGITLDAAGNVYVSDGNNGCIRKITPAGVVSTFGDAVLGFPEGIVRDAAGNFYTADVEHSLIYKTSAAGEATVLAGSTFGLVDGAGGKAKFLNPEGLAIDAAGNLYVGDLGNNAIRKITPDGVVSTIGGNQTHGAINGPGPDARFYNPSGITADALGNIYVGDTVNSLIRKLE
jgi:sugar lactone lactonase YvrE